MFRLLEFYNRFKRYILMGVGALTFILMTFKSIYEYLFRIKTMNEGREGIPVYEKDPNDFKQVGATPSSTPSSTPSAQELPTGVTSEGKATLSAEGKLEPVPEAKPNETNSPQTTQDLINKLDDIINGK